MPWRPPVKFLFHSLWMNPMIRCQIASPARRALRHWPVPRVVPALVVALAFCAGLPIAEAQVRDFPIAALRGTLQVTAPPQVVLDGHPDQLAPGARIRNEQNLFVLSGSIAGQELLVNYTRDPAGLLREVWILSPDEAKLKRERAPSRSNPVFRFFGF